MVGQLHGCRARGRGARIARAAFAVVIMAAAAVFLAPAPASAQGYGPSNIVATGDRHSCVQTRISAIYCWGDDTAGQLGDGSAGGGSLIARRVVGLDLGDDIVYQIVAGAAHTCVATMRGRVLCWGDNSRGQLGTGAAGGLSADPVEVGGALSGVSVTQLAAGGEHTCALSDAAEIFCWGSDADGQLGDDPALADQPAPVPVRTAAPSSLAGERVGMIAAHRYNTCAVDVGGAAHCWGGDQSWQLGDGDAGGDLLGDPDRPLPVAVSSTGVLSGRDLVEVDIGAGFACAVDSDGVAYCWGENLSGELGDGNAPTDSPVPVAVDTSGALNGLPVFSLDTGDRHGCAISLSLAPYCWGENQRGELGNGDAGGADVDTPVAVSAPGAGQDLETLDVDSRSAHTCAVALQFAVRCWGANTDGQLGDGSTTDRRTPVAVQGLPVAPQPPTGVAITPGDTSLGVSWRAPTDLGSGTLVGHAVFAFPASELVVAQREMSLARLRALADDFGGFCAVEAPATTCTVDGLTNGHRYTVFVLAITTDEVSDPSEPVTGIPGGGGGGGMLADTGTEPGVLLLTGAGLIIAGIALARAWRRRIRWVV